MSLYNVKKIQLVPLFKVLFFVYLIVSFFVCVVLSVIVPIFYERSFSEMLLLTLPFCMFFPPVLAIKDVSIAWLYNFISSKFKSCVLVVSLESEEE